MKRVTHPDVKARAVDLYLTTDYTQAEVAQAFGVHPRTIARWVDASGRVAQPTVGDIERIREAEGKLGITA